MMDGMVEFTMLPVPSCPLALLPVAHELPSLVTMTLWRRPAAASTAGSELAISTGGVRVNVVPSPSWPDDPPPHALTVPLLLTARLWERPATTILPPLIPVVTTGVKRV